MASENDGLDLGWFELCLNVADLARSIEFYRKLGFRTAAENRDGGFAVLVNGSARLALYQGHIDGNLLNFRGADVFAIAAELKRRGLSLLRDAEREADGSAGAEIVDPDGNVLYFNTYPGESKAE